MKYNFEQDHYIESLHICTRILIFKDRPAVFTNYPSVTKDQALEEIVLTLFHPVVHMANSPLRCRQRLTLKSRTGKFSAQ